MLIVRNIKILSFINDKIVDFSLRFSKQGATGYKYHLGIRYINPGFYWYFSEPRNTSSEVSVICISDPIGKVNAHQQIVRVIFFTLIERLHFLKLANHAILNNKYIFV